MTTYVVFGSIDYEESTMSRPFMTQKSAEDYKLQCEDYERGCPLYELDDDEGWDKYMRWGEMHPSGHGRFGDYYIEEAEIHQ